MSKPIYVVLEITDEIEDVQGMLTELVNASKVTLDADGYRFTEVRVQRVGTVSP